MALDHERARAAFDVHALEVFLDGGEAIHRRRSWLRSLVESDPSFDRTHAPWLSKRQSACFADLGPSQR